MQPYLAEEFLIKDTEKMLKATQTPNKVVYDCMDQSPFYNNVDDKLNLDEKNAIELPPLIPEELLDGPKKQSFNLNTQIV